MEKKEVGMYRLLIIIIILTASIWFLNKHKSASNTQTTVDTLHELQAVKNLPTDQAYNYIQSLLPSHDIDLIVKVTTQLAHHNAQTMIEKLIQTPLLSAEEKIKIIFGNSAYHSGKKNIQYALFDILIAHPCLQENTSILLTLIKSKYNEQLALFTQWAKEQSTLSSQPSLWKSFVEQAFYTAIKHDDYAVIELLLSKKIKITEEKASKLLLSVIENNKNSEFVPLLVKHAHADVNYAVNGKTLLIAAVEQNNIKLVHALLEAGAVVDRIVDHKKGTALQIAMANKYTSAEQLLREYGA